jgi:hypothetical protein
VVKYLKQPLTIAKVNKGVRKLKNFGNNTSAHQQELVETKPKRNISNQKVESVNNKVLFVMQNKYYNSPSSLIASAQQTNSSNTRTNSGYRRSNASSVNGHKHSTGPAKPFKDISRIQNLNIDSMIKNSKTNMNIKHRKSENLRTIKARMSNPMHSKNNNKSNYIVGGSNVISLKNSQNLFTYPVNNHFSNEPTEGDDNFVADGGKISNFKIL